MIREKIWTNEKARRQIGAVLGRRQLLRSSGASYDDLALSPLVLDSAAVNFRVVSFGMGGLDDLTAALGNFVFKIAIAGEVEQATGGQTRVTIHEVGVFVRDSYDFNGSQFLGFWDDKDNAVSMVNPLSGTSVTNDDFRAWRTAKGAGGDFLVFSNVKRVAINPPDVVLVT